MGLIGTFCLPVFGWGFGAAPKETGPGEQPFGVCLVVREGAGALFELAHTVFSRASLASLVRHSRMLADKLWWAGGLLDLHQWA